MSFFNKPWAEVPLQELREDGVPDTIQGLLLVSDKEKTNFQISEKAFLRLKEWRLRWHVLVSYKGTKTERELFRTSENKLLIRVDIYPNKPGLVNLARWMYLTQVN